MKTSLNKKPTLTILKGLKSKNVPDPHFEYQLEYESEIHKSFPHIIKFSGGRSSGMMLLTLLENGSLKRERGDVIVFNNTSAEHPMTYEFTRRCKELVESKYGIPFFWIEFQTYEDTRKGEWTRLATYRLVNPEPYSKQTHNGYLHRGEVYEEMLSWSGYVPNRFQRTCTAKLKIWATREFLKDWLACKLEIEHQGHFKEKSRINIDELFRRHQKHGGAVPWEIFKQKKEFLCSRSVSRPNQKFASYSPSFKLLNNPYLLNKSYGNKVSFGAGEVEYLSFIGLRHDEGRRIMNIRERYSIIDRNSDDLGEHIYIPLDDMQIDKRDVSDFWKKQDFNLELNDDDSLSNCTYCFLKGLGKLNKAHQALEKQKQKQKKKREWEDTPCDLNWWIKLEKKYGRDLKAEKREIKKKVENDFIGFFSHGFTYEMLGKSENKNILTKYTDNNLPCECTD